MPTNPLATSQQREAEDRAMALLQRDDLKRVRAIVTTLFKNVSGWPDRDQADRLEPMIDEYMFHNAIRAANIDPDFPTVVRFMVPPHHWFGRDVPGSRWGGDSPDFCYRTIPVAHGGRYVIDGRPTCACPPIAFYSLMGDNTAAPQTLGLLESLDMRFESDGSFQITVDETPANGRPNHIQTKPGSEFIMVRDAHPDWENQSPNALAVTRINPAGRPRSEDDLARHAAKIALDGVYYTFYTMRSGQGQEPNNIREPLSSAIFGGVPTQWGTKGSLDLAPEDAIVIRSNAANASFRNLVLTDVFYLSLNYWDRTGSLNCEQMVPDEDGNFTTIISHQDPGVHNWLDTGGLRRSVFGHRWQAFVRGEQGERPWMTAKVVRFADLGKVLPAGVPRLDETGRKAQVAGRTAGFSKRFIDN
jgi:hypothetical protein